MAPRGQYSPLPAAIMTLNLRLIDLAVAPMASIPAAEAFIRRVPPCANRLVSRSVVMATASGQCRNQPLIYATKKRKKQRPVARRKNRAARWHFLSSDDEECLQIWWLGCCARSVYPDGTDVARATIPDVPPDPVRMFLFRFGRRALFVLGPSFRPFIFNFPRWFTYRWRISTKAQICPGGLRAHLKKTDAIFQHFRWQFFKKCSSS